MEAKNSEIVCPVSGKIIWKQVYGASGEVSRYKTEFDDIRLIAAGGYGCVFECSNKLDEQRYAIKKILLQGSDMDFDHVVREVKAMAAMSHPNIVRYYSAWVEREIAGKYYEAGREKGSYEEPECIDGPVLYIQQELCSSSLSDLLANGALEEKKVRDIYKDIVLGLDHIHKKGVRHGDLSSSNIFFDEDGNAKIGDFGLASLIESGVFGQNSPRHICTLHGAPELNEGKYSLSSDIYSLGIILLEMFIGYATDSEKVKEIDHFKKHHELMSPSHNDDEEKMDFIRHLTHSDPSARPSTRSIIDMKHYFAI